MANKDQNIPTQGMSNDHPMNLKDSQYPLMVNGNIQTDISGPITLTNEHSNILCLQEKFSSNYKLIGSLFVPENNVTYVFLTDGSGNSEIGFVSDCQYVDTTDTPEQDPCDHCDTINIEQPPLEDQDPSACCTYTCISNSTCLNFDIDFPIRKPIYKKDNCGGTLYFTDFLNPVRALKLTPENTLDDSVRAVDYYECDGEVYNSCEEATQDGCTCCQPIYVQGCTNNIDCDKLRLFPKASAICITPEIIAAGGSLRAGTYQLAACYADSNGQRATKTFSTSNPVSIFDRTQTITSETSYPTNFAVKFKLEDLNPELYPYINVFVVATINNVPSVKQYGPIDITSVQNGVFEYLVTDFEKGIDVTIDDILQVFPVYEKAQEITTAGNVLLLGNLTSPQDLNLQPAIVNLALTPGAIQWQTIKAKENFYANGVYAGQFRGFLRDEIYPLGIVFERNNTLDTCVYPFVGREAIASDLEPAPANNDNFNPDPCEEIANIKTWQVYNTASDGSAACGASGDSPQCVQQKESVYCNSYSYHYTIISYTDLTGTFDPTATLTGPSGTAEIITLGSLNGNNYIYVQNVTGTFAIGDVIVADGSAVITQYTEGSSDPKDCYVNESDASADCSGNYPTDYNDPSIDGTGDCDPNPDVSGWCVDHKVRSLTDSQDPSAKALCVDATLALYPTNVSIPYANLIESSIEQISPPQVLDVTCYDSTATLAGDIPDNYPNPSTGLGGQGPFFFPGFQDSPNVSNRSRSGASTIVSTNNATCVNADYTPPNLVMYFWGSDYAAVTDNLFCYGTGENCDGFSECGVEETTESAAGGDVFGVNTPIGSDYQPYWFTFNALKITQVVSIKLFARLTTTIPTGILEATLYESDGTTVLATASNDASGNIVLIAGDVCKGDPPLTLGRQYYVKVALTLVPDGTNFPDLNQVIATSNGWDCSDKKTLATYNYAWASICINAPDGREATINVPAYYRRRCKYDIYYRQYQMPSTGCDYTNYEYGNFAYWESQTKVYPKSTYIDASGNVAPIWGSMCGKPIRHFKFPDNYASPFQDYNQLGPSFGRVSNIYVLGFNVDTEQVKTWLLWAESQGLITTDERKSITGYKLVRGNRVGNKSIAAKGLLYDMWRYNLYNYQSKTTDVIPTYYSSYPFNDLRNDNYLTYGDPLNANGASTQSPNSFVHPYSGLKNSNFAFLSPDTTFNSPTIGTELKIEGMLYGDGLGSFYTVLNHPKYVILSNGGIALVQTLTILTWIVDLVNFILEIYKTFQAGFTFTVGTVVSTAMAAVSFALTSVGNYLKYGKQWQDIVIGFGVPQNFAKYFVGVGNYHSLTSVIDLGNVRRLIADNLYLTGGNYNISLYGNTLKINNYKREDSVFIALNPQFPIQYAATNLLSTANSDTSRYTISQVGATRDIQSRVASLYSAIKYYNPDQYGELSDVEWLYTGTCRKITWDTTQDDSCSPVFGGDTFISRMTQKRKFPFFLNTAVGVASSDDFQYRLLGNITTPSYYFNSLGESPANSTGVNFKANETNLDDASYAGLYTKGSMYLFSYGITSFLCESDYNLNFRYATDNRDRAFYPYQADLEGWTQEYKIPIDVPNSYQYNRDYSKQNKENFFCTQPGIYSNDLCITTYKNRVVNSQVDNDSDFFSDPWRIFLANDYKDFPLENGQLVGLDGVERDKLVLRFNKTTWVLNAYYTMTTDTGVAQIGAASLFQQKPMEYSRTEIGYGGSQHHAFVTSQFGHFWVDAARSAVFMLPAGDGGLQEISMSLNNFFNNNLPFFILKAFPNFNVDNNYKEVGIAMGWDNKFDRLFLTKRDYELKTAYVGKVTYQDGKFYYMEQEIFLTDSTYFCNKSWTMAYSPQTKSWISYYSFIPNYYIGHENYFQTGINYSQTNDSNELGLWDHLLTNKSYQVFYGKLYPFITDVVVKEQLINKQLQSIEYQADFLRFQNDYDYFYNPGVTFNKMVIWTENRNSGNLELVPQIPGNLAQSGLYPVVNPNSTTILTTRKENTWRVNQFWDLVRNKYNNVPPMVYNCHPYLKEVNPVAINYNKPTFEKSRITSDYIFLRFINDKYSNYKIINKWFINSTIKSYT